jgi:3-isopropylmalate/(R)-2-methylmalate dehydratase small subunit
MSAPPGRIEGVAAPMPAANIDTDVIMPKRYLKRIDREGLGDGVFGDLRRLPDGAPDPDFVLNRAPWRQAGILLTGPNFGCGSSREHAVWGLRQAGIKALIGPSFAGIFHDNCWNNALPAIVLADSDVARLMALAHDPARCRLRIDLATQRIEGEGVVLSFSVDAARREMMLEGLDAIAATLRWRENILRFEKTYHREYPWLA